MKYLLLAICILCVQNLAGESPADTVSLPRWTDVSFWQIIKIKADQQKAPALWVNHEHGKFFMEARMNFDWRETAGLVAGKTFSKREAFWITPKAGALFGYSSESYNGLVFEANLGGTIKKFKYFAFNQVAVSFQKKNPAFFYQFTDLGYASKYISPSLAFQLYQEALRGTEPFFDIGPQLTVPIGKFYLKGWYTIDPKHLTHKVTFGAGYTF